MGEEASRRERFVSRRPFVPIADRERFVSRRRFVRDRDRERFVSRRRSAAIVAAGAASAPGTPRARGGARDASRVDVGAAAAAAGVGPEGDESADGSTHGAPTQDARTTSTLTEPNDAVTETETTAMTAVERVMERMEREFERRRGKATEGHAPVGTGNMPPPPSVPSVPSAPRASCRRRAWIARGTLRRRLAPPSPTQPTPGSTLGRGGRWGGVDDDATGWGGTPAVPGRRVWLGGAPRSSFAIPSPEPQPTEPTPTEPKPTEPKPTPPPSLEGLWTPREGRNPSLKNLNRR